MSSFFTDTILEREKKYFEQNRVFSVNQKDDKTYTAIVLGSEAYHTKITLDEHYNVMSATCDCPYAKDGHHCKQDRKSTRLNSSHRSQSRMPSSA